MSDYNDIVTYQKHLDNLINILDVVKYDEVIYLGDFNLSNITWSYHSKSLLPINIKSDVDILVISTILSQSLMQCNSILNNNGKVLDLVFASNDLKINCTECVTPISKNTLHHKALCINFKFYNFDTQTAVDVAEYNYLKADYKGIRSFFVETDWSFLDSASDPADSYEILCRNISNAVSKFVPLKKSVTNNKPPWFNPRLVNLKNRKSKAFKKSKASNSKDDYAQFLTLRKEFNSLHNFLFTQYMLSIETTLKSNPSSFWHYIKTKRKTTGFPASLEYDGNVSDNTQSSCDLFAQFFQKVYDRYNTTLFPTLPASPLQTISSFEISNDDVLLAISKLKPSARSDSEGFSPHLFKTCADLLARPLLLIFKMCLNSGTFIDSWKLCWIEPVYKSGDRNDVCNYRPIVKQSTIAKLFDQIIQIKLFDHINQVISHCQHGFFPGRSTCSNLVLATNKIISAFKNCSQLDVIYTDFSKAFDKVDHSILLYKLEHNGIGGNLLKFFASFLKGRRLLVKIGPIVSKVIVNAWSGIPQGTHSGPLLFTIFVNDLPKYFKFANCLMFADDIKLLQEVHNLKDSQNLQSDLDAFQNWCSSNHLFLNVNKCFILTYTRKPNYFCVNYKLNNCILSRKWEMKDLGIIFDTKLSFTKHIDYVISKAFAMVGFIRRNSTDFKDPQTLKSLYVALVRSRIEYCSLIWNPYYEVHSRKIENVQKIFTKIALFKMGWQDYSAPYISRRKLLGLQSLHDRRIYFSIIFVYNIINGNIDCKELLSQFQSHISFYSLRINRLFNISSNTTNYAFNEPLVRSARLCNNYCNIINFNDNIVKFKLDLFTIFN